MSEEKLVPKLRFSGFTDEWNEVTLNDVATFSKGKGISKNDVSNYGIECVRYGELYTKYNEMIYNIESKTDLDKNELKLSEKNDILIPCSGETAIDLATASCIQKDQVAIGGDITVIKTNQYAPFITYYLNQKKTEIAKYAQGVSIVHLYPKDFKVMNIRIPSINEQKMIIRLLEEITKKEQLLESKYQQYQEFKKYLMQQIFTQKLRFADFNNSSWKDYKFKDLGTVKSGVGFSNKYQGHLDLDYNFYKVSDMNLKGNEKVMTRSNNTIDDNLLKDIGVKLIENPSIIFAKVGEAIFLNRKRIAKQPFLIDNNMMAFSPNENVDLEFMYYLATSINFGKYAQTGALPSYNASDIYSIKCKIPPIEEQKRIGKLLSLADNKIDFCSNQINNILDFKKGLLQQMFV